MRVPLSSLIGGSERSLSAEMERRKRRFGCARARSTSASRLRRVTKRRELIVPAVIVGVLLIALAVLYWAEPAKSLPSFIPGHKAGSAHHHVKHGLAAFLLGLACLVFAWFQTGGERTPTTAA